MRRQRLHTTDQRLLAEIRDHLVALPLAKELKHQDVETAKKLRRELDDLHDTIEHQAAVIKLLSRAAGIDPEVLTEDELALLADSGRDGADARVNGSTKDAAPVADALFSPCRTWRYSLTREILDPAIGCLDEGERGGTVTFVGLNPSTADETTDDPTIRRCVRFARDWGFDRLKMVNLYAWRATSPWQMFEEACRGTDVVGPENDHNLSLAFGGSDRIVAAWGVNAEARRLEQFAETFGGWQFWALGVTKDGCPRHPLYMPAAAQPFFYDLAVQHG